MEKFRARLRFVFNFVMCQRHIIFFGKDILLAMVLQPCKMGFVVIQTFKSAALTPFKLCATWETCIFYKSQESASLTFKPWQQIQHTGSHFPLVKMTFTKLSTLFVLNNILNHLCGSCPVCIRVKCSQIPIAQLSLISSSNHIIFLLCRKV